MALLQAVRNMPLATLWNMLVLVLPAVMSSMPTDTFADVTYCTQWCPDMDV